MRNKGIIAMTWFDITWHGLSWLDMAFHGLTGQHMCTPELTIWETRGKLPQSAHLSWQYEKRGENRHKVHTWADNMRNEGIIAMTWLDMVCHDLTWRFMAWQDNTCAHLSWQYEKWRDNRHDMNWHDLTFVPLSSKMWKFRKILKNSGDHPRTLRNPPKEFPPLAHP